MTTVQQAILFLLDNGNEATARALLAYHEQPSATRKHRAHMAARYCDLGNIADQLTHLAKTAGKGDASALDEMVRLIGEASELELVDEVLDRLRERETSE